MIIECLMNFPFKQKVANREVMHSVHAHAVNGVFEIQSMKNKSVITFNSSSIKRFSVAVAYIVDGLWRLRYRIVVTLQDGILCFPLYSTIGNRNGVCRVPKECDLNTVLIIGIATEKEKSDVTLRIYANELGCIEDDFNGYKGTVTFDAFLDKALISESLQQKTYANGIRFDRNLYKSMQHHQPDDTQHVHFEESWCPNCSMVSNHPINTIQNYRTNVYGQVAKSMFKVRIENSADVLYVFNKTAGIFEV